MMSATYIIKLVVLGFSESSLEQRYLSFKSKTLVWATRSWCLCLLAVVFVVVPLLRGEDGGGSLLVTLLTVAPCVMQLAALSLGPVEAMEMLNVLQILSRRAIGALIACGVIGPFWASSHLKANPAVALSYGLLHTIFEQVRELLRDGVNL